MYYYVYYQPKRCSKVANVGNPNGMLMAITLLSTLYLFAKSDR